MAVAYSYTETDRVFAFSPYKVDITGLTASQKVVIVFNGTTINRYADSSGNLSVPLSKMYQSFFADVEFGVVTMGSDAPTMLLDKSITFTPDGGSTETHTVDIIWGALQIAETEPTVETIYHFEGYPLSINQTQGAYLANDTAATISSSSYGKAYDVGTYVEDTYATAYIDVRDGESLDVYGLGDASTTEADSYGLGDATTTETDSYGGLDASGVGDTYYQLLKRYYIKYNNCSHDGYYIRWIDTYGEYKYYFLNFGSSQITGTPSVTFNQYLWDLEPTSNVLYKGRTQVKNKAVGKVLNLGTSSADDTLTNHLEGIVKSIKHWIYNVDTETWTEVQLSESNITRQRLEGARELSFQFILPDYYIQSL